MITVVDEEFHTPGTDPDWQESYYFNWSTNDGRSFGLTRIGVNRSQGTGDAVLIILRDGKAEVVYAAVDQPLAKAFSTSSVTEGISVGALTFTMDEALSTWQISLRDGHDVDLVWSAFTPAYDFHGSFPGDGEQSQAHFEQSGGLTMLVSSPWR